MRAEREVQAHAEQRHMAAARGVNSLPNEKVDSVRVEKLLGNHFAPILDECARVTGLS